LIKPVLNGSHDATDLLLYLSQIALSLFVCGLRRRRVERQTVCLNEGADQIGMQKAVAQACQCPSSYKVAHQSGFSIGGSGSFV
jgi:hypothetical protein